MPATTPATNSLAALGEAQHVHGAHERGLDGLDGVVPVEGGRAGGWVGGTGWASGCVGGQRWKGCARAPSCAHARPGDAPPPQPQQQRQPATPTCSARARLGRPGGRSDPPPAAQAPPRRACMRAGGDGAAWAARGRGRRAARTHPRVQAHLPTRPHARTHTPRQHHLQACTRPCARFPAPTHRAPAPRPHAPPASRPHLISSKFSLSSRWAMLSLLPVKKLSMQMTLAGGRGARVRVPNGRVRASGIPHPLRPPSLHARPRTPSV